MIKGIYELSILERGIFARELYLTAIASTTQLSSDYRLIAFWMPIIFFEFFFEPIFEQEP